MSGKCAVCVFVVLFFTLFFVPGYGDCTESSDKFGRTSLHLASSRGDTEIVELLLEAGAKVNDKNKFGWTPLHLASRQGHIEIVQMLLKAGADPGAKNKFGRTPLDYAVKYQHTDIVRMLAR